MDKFAKIAEEPSTPTPSPSPHPGGIPRSSRNTKPHLKPGYVIDGRFRVESLIAAGGFGCVYLVRHVLMNKLLAVKTMDPIVASENTLLRLQRESKAVGKLDHPNIVHASDFGLIDGAVPYLVMEFVEGPTLAEHLKRCTRLPMETALQIFIPVCEALAYAHNQGVIHRDIKPSNIILTRDDREASRWIPKLVDFGIAKLTLNEESEALSLTKTGDIFGTPLYMSPEQCASSSVDNRSDIYALGCVLFEALAGTPPFRGATALETMMQHANAEAPSLKEASLGLDFPDALERVLAKMLAKDNRDRYQSCTEAAKDMQLLMQGDVDQMQVTLARRAGTRVSKPQLRSDWIQAIAVAAGLFTVGIICGGFAVSTYIYKVDMPNIVASTQASTSREQREAVTNPVSLVPDNAYFRTDPESATLQFSPLINLGDLHWWTKKASGSVPAKGPVTSIPAGASIALEASDSIIEAPFYWGHFRSTDLTGVLITAPQHQFQPDFDNMDLSTAYALQQQDLSLLKLEYMDIRQRTFDAIGEVPKLKWLWTKKLRLLNDAKKRLAPATGSELASLKNIRNLDTLVIKDIDVAAPVLKSLKFGKIRRLRISGYRLTAQDYALLKQLPSLEVLDVTVSAEDDIGLFWDSVSNLPNLKKLMIVRPGDHPLLIDAPIYRFPKLETLVINLYDDQQNRDSEALLQKHLQVPRSFDWHKDLQMKQFDSDGWFGPFQG